MNFPNDGQSIVMLGWVMRYDSNGNNNNQYYLLFWSIPTSVPYQSPYFQQNTSEFWYAGLPLFEQGSDGITYAPDIIIVGVIDIVYWVQFITGIRTWKHENMRTCQQENHGPDE